MPGDALKPHSMTDHSANPGVPGKAENKATCLFARESQNWERRPVQLRISKGGAAAAEILWPQCCQAPCSDWTGEFSRIESCRIPIVAVSIWLPLGFATQRHPDAQIRFYPILPSKSVPCLDLCLVRMNSWNSAAAIQEFWFSQDVFWIWMHINPQILWCSETLFRFQSFNISYTPFHLCWQA